MTTLFRPTFPSARHLLTHILDEPELLAAVRQLPGPKLGQLIEHIGLEDAGPIVALASTDQLIEVFDHDLWRASAPGDDEQFRPERFALWLSVMHEAGEDVLVARLSELPKDTLTLALHRLMFVVDMDALTLQVSRLGDELESIDQALASCMHEEWEEYRLIARDQDAWDSVWTALLALDRDHHHLLRELLDRCFELSGELIDEQGGLYEVLTSEEMLEGDVQAERMDRRASDGYVAPADARAFLELARSGAGGEARDALTLAYFRELPDPAKRARLEPASGPASNALLRLLQDATPEAPRPHARSARARMKPPAQPVASARERGPGSLAVTQAGSLLERALLRLSELDRVAYDLRVEELGYLANVLIAGSAHDQRSFRPVEALECAIATGSVGLELECARCARDAAGEEASLHDAVAALTTVPADVLFRRGLQRLHVALVVPARARIAELRGTQPHGAQRDSTRRSRAAPLAPGELEGLGAQDLGLDEPTWLALRALAEPAPWLAGPLGRGDRRFPASVADEEAGASFLARHVTA